MKKLKWHLAQAKLKINSKHEDAKVKRSTLQVFCLVCEDFVSIGRTKAIKG